MTDGPFHAAGCGLVLLGNGRIQIFVTEVIISESCTAMEMASLKY